MHFGYCGGYTGNNLKIKELLHIKVLEYIKPELLILLPKLYVIGITVKKTTLITDHLILFIVGTEGILLSIIYVLATSDLGSPQAVAIAIFTALM